MTTIVVGSQHIVVDPPSNKIQIVGYGIKGDQGATGAQGPQGPAGPPGPNTNLANLQDVNTVGLASGQGLYWDLATSSWKPASFLLKSGGTISGALTVTGSTNLNGDVFVGDKIYIGDDAYIEDINELHTLAIKSQTAPTYGFLRLGTGSILRAVPNTLYVDADAMEFRNTAGTVVQFKYTQGQGLYLKAEEWFRVQGSSGIFWENWGGGWTMTDATWVRVYNGKSLYVLNGIIAADGTGAITAGATTTSGTRNRCYLRYDNGLHSQNWNECHMVLRSQSDPAITGIAFHSNNVAPIIKVHSGTEAFEFRSNADSAFVALKASAFQVNSTLRSKIDVAEIPDADFLAKVKRVKSIRFTQKARPQRLRPSPKFSDINARWVAKGKSPLEVPGRELESHDHDCSIDDCSGTKKKPCSVKLNDHEHVGLSAEDIYQILPEAVHVGQDGLPEGLDVAQIAGAALGAVGALARKIEELEARIAQLEGVSQ